MQATFTGQEYDEENDLQYYGARYYDNQTGRFTTVDPVILRAVGTLLNDPQSLNSYAYALNNPVRYVDPSGETAEEFGWGTLKGAWEGLKETGRAIVATAQNPSVIITSTADVVQEIYSDSRYLVESYVNDPAGTQKQIEASFAWFGESWNNLSDEQKGEITGYALEKSVEAYIGAKAVNKSLKPANTAEYGSTPAGRPYTKHYGLETGPERNIPGSVVDNVLDNYKGTSIEGGKTVYYDPQNNLTVITGDNQSIVSVHKGTPRSGQY